MENNPQEREIEHMWMEPKTKTFTSDNKHQAGAMFLG